MVPREYQALQRKAMPLGNADREFDVMLEVRKGLTLLQTVVMRVGVGSDFLPLDRGDRIDEIGRKVRRRIKNRRLVDVFIRRIHLSRIRRLTFGDVQTQFLLIFYKY